MPRNRKSESRVGQAGWVIKSALFFLGVGLCSGGYLWQKHQLDRLGRRIKKLEVRLEELRRDNDIIRRRYSVLVSPQNLKKRVKDLGLNLVPPLPEQVLRLAEPPERAAVGASAGQVPASLAHWVTPSLRGAGRNPTRL